MEISKDILQWKEAADPIMFVIFSHLALIADEFKVRISPRRLAEQAGLGYQVVRTALRKMEEEGVITQEVTQGKTLVTIWKYIELPNKKKAKVTQKPTQSKPDLSSFVIPEHLDKWFEWLKHKSSKRCQFTTTTGAKKAYEMLVKMSTITITDYSGTQTTLVDTNKLNSIIDYSIAQNFTGLYEPKNHGNNNNYNTGRTTQQDAERIAAQRIAQATQSSISTEEHRRRIEAELGLLG